jgi:hypothetical protein
MPLEFASAYFIDYILVTAGRWSSKQPTGSIMTMRGPNCTAFLFHEPPTFWLPGDLEEPSLAILESALDIFMPLKPWIWNAKYSIKPVYSGARWQSVSYTFICSCQLPDSEKAIYLNFSALHFYDL